MPDRNDRPGVRPGSPANGRPTNGASYPTPFTRLLPDGGEAGGALDLVAVQADDELVTALGRRPSGSATASPGNVLGRPDHDTRPPAGDRPADGTTDDRLVVMLAAWRAEIDAEPIPELIDLDAAVAAVVSGIEAQELSTRRRRAGRLRQLAPLAAAAAIIVATVTGVGLGSQNAMPGDTLWTIQKVVNPERAESVEAKVAVEGHLQKVRTALQTGDTATAEQELRAANTEISSVRGQEGRPALAQEQEFLAAKLVDTPPGTPADLSTPAKSNPTARSTSAPTPPPSTSTGPSTTEPSASSSAGQSPSTAPDVRRSGPDPSGAAVAPARPGNTDPALRPAPPPAPQVTRAPDITLPEPKPDPTGPGRTEGGPDPRIAPDPRTVPGTVDEPPATSKPSGGGDDTPTSKTTSASGSAGASVETTAAASTS